MFKTSMELVLPSSSKPPKTNKPFPITAQLWLALAFYIGVKSASKVPVLILKARTVLESESIIPGARNLPPVTKILFLLLQ